MEFGDDEEEEGESGRSGSAEVEDGEEGDWKKLALGSGSGGVKGRRKGMVFKCEHCSKVSCPSGADRSLFTADESGIPASIVLGQAPLGAFAALERAYSAQHEQAPAGANARGKLGDL